MTADTEIPAPAPEIRVTLSAHGERLASESLPAPAGTPPERLLGTVEHLGGSLRVEIGLERLWTTPVFFDLPPVWISDLKIEADIH